MTPKEIIKSKITIEDVLSKYAVHRDNRGWILCPCHQDRKPSMKVYPESNSCYCFTCGKSLDIIDFVMVKENCKYKEALNKISTMFGLGISGEMTLEQKEELSKKLRDFRIKQEHLAYIEANSKKWRGKILESIKIQAQVIEKNKPYNPNKFYNYAACKNPLPNLMRAESEIERLEWIYDAISEFINSECEYDYTLYGNYVCDKEDLKDRKLYILRQLDYHNIEVQNGQQDN